MVQFEIHRTGDRNRPVGNCFHANVDCSRVNVTDPAMAKEMLEALPLGREHLMSFELVPLGPLTPLRQLLPAHPQ